MAEWVRLLTEDHKTTPMTWVHAQIPNSSVKTWRHRPKAGCFTSQFVTTVQVSSYNKTCSQDIIENWIK
jgi:hypothetical protein